MRPVLLFCLLFTMSFSALCQNDDCYYDDSPLYMATVKLNIYEYMSSESAVIGEVPKGATVVVTESFFGETGWWEICYKGITGQVKKSSLTKAKKFKVPQSKKDRILNLQSQKMRTAKNNGEKILALTLSLVKRPRQ